MSIATVKARILSEHRPLQKAASPLCRNAVACVVIVTGAAERGDEYETYDWHIIYLLGTLRGLWYFYTHNDK